MRALTHLDLGRTCVAADTLRAVATLPAGRLRVLGVGDSRATERHAAILEPFAASGAVLDLYGRLPLVAPCHSKHAAAGMLMLENTPVAGLRRATNEQEGDAARRRVGLRVAGSAAAPADADAPTRQQVRTLNRVLASGAVPM